MSALVSKITNLVRRTIRSIGAVANEVPWFASLALLAIFLVV